MTDHAVDLGREILRISRPFLTKSAPSVTYNEFTYQSEGLTLPQKVTDDRPQGAFYVL